MRETIEPGQRINSREEYVAKGDDQLKRRGTGGHELTPIRKQNLTMFASSLMSLDSSVHKSLVAMNRASWGVVFVGSGE
jgi:hypothetical protein